MIKKGYAMLCYSLPVHGAELPPVDLWNGKEQWHKGQETVVLVFCITHQYDLGQVTFFS